MMDINTLYVQTQGNYGNVAIIFLHAFPMSSEMWKGQMKYFSKTHYTLAPDLPGFGKGGLPPHAVTFEYYVDSVLNFLKESGIKKSIWCGISMGGHIALRLYEKAPDLCCGLILANTKAEGDDNVTKSKRWLAIKALKRHRGEFDEAQCLSLVGESSQENLVLKNLLLNMISKNSDKGISAGLVALASRRDCTQVLSKITVPTLIIASDEDKIVSVNDAEVLNRGIKRSKLEIIYQAGHLSNLERPDKFNQAVTDFLDQFLDKNRNSLSY